MKKEQIIEIAAWLKETILECNPEDHCQRCDDLRVHIATLESIATEIEQLSSDQFRNPESSEAVKDNKDLINELNNQVFELRDRLDTTRNYLMGVGPKDLTAEDCLDMLGYGRNGLG